MGTSVRHLLQVAPLCLSITDFPFALDLVPVGLVCLPSGKQARLLRGSIWWTAGVASLGAQALVTSCQLPVRPLPRGDGRDNSFSLRTMSHEPNARVRELLASVGG